MPAPPRAYGFALLAAGAIILLFIGTFTSLTSVGRQPCYLPHEDEARPRNQPEPPATIAAPPGQQQQQQQQQQQPQRRRLGPSCQLRTTDGACVADALDAIDALDQEKHAWPTVDIVVRSSRFDMPPIEYFFKSVELFWPRGVGKVIVVFDTEDAEFVRVNVPDYVTIFYETFPKNISFDGRFANQWSQFWADNYTDAEYIVYCDSDSILYSKITYDMLFRDQPDGTRRSLLIGTADWQGGIWAGSSKYFLRIQHVAGNFMNQMPIIFPRKILQPMREHIRRIHNKTFFDEVMYDFGASQPIATFVSYGIMGNYIHFNMPDAAEVLIEENPKAMPAMRFGAHIPYSRKMHAETGSEYKFNGIGAAPFVKVAGQYVHEALCVSLPPGKLPGCDQPWIDRDPRILWEYGSNWVDGKCQSATPRWQSPENLTALAAKHFDYLHSLYFEGQRRGLF